MADTPKTAEEMAREYLDGFLSNGYPYRTLVTLVESAMAAGKAAAWEEGRLAGGSHYDAIRAHFQAGESEPDPLINPYGDGKSTHSHFVVFGSQRWLCGCKFDRDHNPNGNVNYDTGIEKPHEQ